MTWEILDVSESGAMGDVRGVYLHRVVGEVELLWVEVCAAPVASGYQVLVTGRKVSSFASLDEASRFADLLDLDRELHAVEVDAQLRSSGYQVHVTRRKAASFAGLDEAARYAAMLICTKLERWR